MENLTHYPQLIFAVSFLSLWLAAWLGKYFVRKRLQLDDEIREDFRVILGATLTLLGLIIAFSFSMAADRYNRRRIYEASEANAIGTEYVRTDLLPAADADKVRALLGSYLDRRVAFYLANGDQERQAINAQTAQLRGELWSTVLPSAAAQPTPITALAVAGMNDVFNSQGYTQAEFWNRIPLASWTLMGSIAIGCNLLVGYGARSVTSSSRLLPILPLLVSIAFMLIADIDSPRHGIIRVRPLNLIHLAESLRPDSSDAPTNESLPKAMPIAK